MVNVLQRSKWVSADTLQAMCGITPKAAAMKRTTGVWLEGREWVKAPDGKIKYNWQSVDEWTEGRI